MVFLPGAQHSEGRKVQVFDLELHQAQVTLQGRNETRMEKQKKVKDTWHSR